MSDVPEKPWRDDRPKVVITDFDFGDIDVERKILEAVGAEVVGLQSKQEEDLFEAARDCAAMINQYARVGRSTISRMQKCEVIARYGVGVDIVDVDAATERGILVTNVQDYCTEEVADHAIALWLTLARKLPDYDRATHNGIWRWQSGQPVNRIRGRTMGIVSFGKIGQAIAARARAFGATMIAYDPFLPETVARKARCRTGRQGRAAEAQRLCPYAGSNDPADASFSLRCGVCPDEARCDPGQYRPGADRQQRCTLQGADRGTVGRGGPR